jgi:hypothetical protein
MSGTEISIDPVAVVIALLTMLFGPQLAAYVGPYIVIAGAGLTGAAFALGRRDPGAKLGPFMFLAVMVGMSMLLTVISTEIAVKLWPDLESRWLIAPVALMIGYVGDDWPEVLLWFVRRISRLIEKRVEGGK